eukprot:XP_011683874.1 PREDICTED: uncharacterized protein LOC100891197 [Strongylocentrotus purpuratus]
MPRSPSTGRAGNFPPKSDTNRGHRLYQHTNNLYVAMDEDQLDVIIGDDDGQNGDVDVGVNGVGRRRKVLHVGDNGVTHRVVIDRGCYSMTEFHEQHGYQRKDKLSPREFVQRKIKRCRCGVDQFLGLIVYIFPAFDWLRQYNLRNNAVGDLMAGITVGIVNIPQILVDNIGTYTRTPIFLDVKGENRFEIQILVLVLIVLHLPAFELAFVSSNLKKYGTMQVGDLMAGITVGIVNIPQSLECGEFFGE